jgi:4'-phosphopantetheinyl transferase
MNWLPATGAIWDVANDPSKLPGNLRDGDVHLWRWRLEQAVTSRDEVWLTPDEQVRAARYRFDLPRQNFVAARVGLRRILSSYLGIDAPCAFPFSLGPHGKPALALPEQQWLRFNIAHTGDFALCILCREREVGIDVEHIAGSQTSVDAMAYAVRRLCSPAERRFLDQDLLDAEHRFLTLWTCKEAVGKAEGRGLKPPIPAMDAVLTTGPTAFPDAWVQREAGGTWRVVRIEPFPGTVGALAVEGREERAEATMPQLTWFDLSQDGV